MAWIGLSERGYALSLESTKILEQLERPLDLAKVLDGLSLNSYYLAHFEDEEYAMRRINEIAIEFNDDWLLAYSLFLWSLIETRKQNYSEVKKHANASLRLFEEMGDTFSSAWPLLSLGGGFLAEESYQEASGYYKRGLRISEKFGFRWLMENASKYLGKISLSLNEIEEAEYYLKKSLIIAQEIGLGREKANLLYEFAALRVAQNRSERAVELLSLVLKLPESNLARIEGGSIQDKCLILLAKIENELPQNEYLAAVKNGQDLALDEIIIELTSPNS
jgi:tetratricopeptide (TPR) repeat protein